MRLHRIFFLAAAVLGLSAGISSCSDTPDCPSGTAGCPVTAANPTCATYCEAIMANCSGAQAMYETKEDCVATCKFFPIGTAADTSGNTLGCRAYHAGAAKADAATHCTHAGPGGDGVCGADCDGYCQIALGACTGANVVYTDAAACKADCAAHKGDVKYVVTNDSGNSVACLLSHATAAPLVPADHCTGDLSMTSTTCKDGAGGAGGAGGGGADAGP